ncbi:MAG: hypothetical protein QOE22_418 [Candidatus Parcubacteria bacterium]|jgi:hypothetical protein|nr:hypothetical protein [Candidatus Parcubacteria bacterium]
MKRNIFLAIILVVVVLIIGFIVTNRKAVAPSPPAENGTATSTAQAAERTFSWRFETTDADDGMAPRTEVALFTGGEAYDAGAYAGSCTEIAEENLLPGEVSGVLCWWAGGGDEIGVFRDEDLNYFLLHGIQEEGTAESDGFRGDFKEIALIK